MVENFLYEYAKLIADYPEKIRGGGGGFGKIFEK